MGSITGLFLFGIMYDSYAYASKMHHASNAKDSFSATPGRTFKISICAPIICDGLGREEVFLYFWRTRTPFSLNRCKLGQVQRS